jgi:hypothetical protein
MFLTTFAQVNDVEIAGDEYNLYHCCEVCKWIALALSMSSDFWLCWLAH